MKNVKKFNEANDVYTTNEQELINSIEHIIDNEVYLRDVRWGDGDMEMDPDTITDAAKAIVRMLKEKGII